MLNIATAACSVALAGGTGGPVSLKPSLQPLADHFNAGRGKPRFVAIVSSTCPACVFGAEAVKASVLNAYPDADIQVSLVWIDMLPSDSEAAALKSSQLFGDPPDPRLKQFHDPDQRTGRAFAPGLLKEGGGPAWDIYLYYDKDAVWSDRPPKPVEWYHQLSGTRRADPALFRPRGELLAALREATARAVEREPAPAGPDEPVPGRTPVRFTGTVLEVGGMDCALCARRVGNALRAVPGVEAVDVSLETGLAWIRLAAEADVEQARLTGAVTRLGFTASQPDASMVLTVPLALLDTGPRLELLYFPGCPLADALCTNLADAAESLGLIQCTIQRVNLAELEPGDPRLGWGSPTILVDGTDLFGAAKPSDDALSCRIYPDNHAPTAEQISVRLQSRLTTDN